MFRVGCALLRASIVKSKQYKLSFYTGLAEGLLMLLTNYVLFYAAFRLGENSFEEYGGMIRRVLYFQMYIGIFYGLFIDNITALKYYIHRGDLDWLMMKPCSTRLLLSLRFISFGHFFSGLTAVPLLIAHIGRMPAPGDLLASAVYFFVLLLDAYALLFAATGLAVIFTSSGNVSSLVMPLLGLGKYPRGTFTTRGAAYLFFLLPPAVLADYGVNALRGQWNYLELAASVALCTALNLAAKGIFRKATELYRSTGS